MSSTDAWLAAARGDAPARLAALRARGRDVFAATGFPTTRHEDWKYTNLAELARGVFAPARDGGPASLPAAAAALGGVRLAFVDGIFAPAGGSAAALPPGAFVGRLADALAAADDRVAAALGSCIDLEAHPLAALNTAHLADGAVVFVPRGVVLEAPVEIVFHAAAAQPTVAHPRVLVVLGEGAHATIVERFLGAEASASFTNAVSEAVLGRGAALTHVRVQEESAAAWHVGGLWVRQEADSRLQSSVVALGGRVARTDIAVALDGRGAECDLDGLYVARGRQHVDHHTAIDHRSPQATSRELYKGVLDDAATGVFNGKVVVRPDAQKSDARQMNKNLLLSDGATVDTKPQLEIFADDVKCSHGATIGRLDAAALFYLRSRGIDAARARDILVYAFANEMLDRIPVEPLRAGLERSLGARFTAAPGRDAA